MQDLKSRNALISIFLLLLFVISVSFLSYLNHYNDKAIYYTYNYVPDYDWFEMQRAYPFSEIPHEARLKSITDYMKYLSKDNMSEYLDWELAGPVNIEGRITAIVTHPFNPEIVIAGSANGGIWKSTNNCQTWISIFDNQNTSSIGALAFNPQNPEIIYCGTGEANSLRSHYAGTGVYKSTNGGLNWQFIGLQNSYNIGNIAVNSSNPQEVYVAVLGAARKKNQDRGVYKTSDGGQTWELSFHIADSVGAVDVAIDPFNPSKVFAAMWERQRREDYIKYGGIKSGLFYTTNSGLNWSMVINGFPNNDPSLGRISIDISKSNPQIIYALTAYSNGTSRGLYKSSDNGISWFLINSTVAGSSNYAWFNRICKVNPANPDLVICGGLNMHISSDGGTTFSLLNASHVDQHAVSFAPSNSNYIALGNDGGIDISTNSGNTWSYSNSLPITQFYAGDVNYQNQSDIIGGTQDNGTIRTLNGGVNNWFEEYGGDGFYCLIDYINPQRIYVESQNGGLARSTNGGLSFISATSGLDLTYTNWSTPIVMDKSNPLILYCGTYKMHKSTNGMQSWNAISPDLTNGHIQNIGTITTIDVSKSNPDIVYCGTDDANVWVTVNGGNNWIKINTGLPDRWVTRVTIHPDSANICYVTLSGYKIDSTGAHIYKTSNYGSTWNSVSGNLPDAPANDIIIDPRDNKTLYLATDLGVMVSRNDGNTWSILGNNYPSFIPVHDLTFHSPSCFLYAWTHGRSCFKINLSTILKINELTSEFKNYILYQNYPNPFNANTKISFTINKKSYVILRIFDIKGGLVKELERNQLSEGMHKYTFNSETLSSGIYFYELFVNGQKDRKKMVLIK